MIEQAIYRVYRASILLKGINAALECLGGFSLYILSTGRIASWVHNLTDGELNADPNDFIANFLLDHLAGIAEGTKSFFAFYLASHGLVKLLLVLGLWLGKRWSYPASIAALALFIVYQLHRYTYTHSIGLILLTVFDLFFIWLIWHEWRRAKNNHSLSNSRTID